MVSFMNGKWQSQLQRYRAQGAGAKAAFHLNRHGRRGADGRPRMEHAERTAKLERSGREISVSLLVLEASQRSGQTRGKRESLQEDGGVLTGNDLEQKNRVCENRYGPCPNAAGARFGSWQQRKFLETEFRDDYRTRNCMALHVVQNFSGSQPYREAAAPTRRFRDCPTWQFESWLLAFFFPFLSITTQAPASGSACQNHSRPA